MSGSQKVLFLHEHSCNSAHHVSKPLRPSWHISCFMELLFIAASTLQCYLWAHDNTLHFSSLFSLPNHRATKKGLVSN